MADIDPRVIEYAEFVAGLTGDDRKASNQFVNQFVAANLPDDVVEAEAAPPVTSLRDYVATEIETPPILVEPGLVVRGAITTMTSRGGKGKTTVSLNRLLRWSAGLPLFDAMPDVLAPTGDLKVLMIENEGVAGHFQEVITKMLNGLPDAAREKALDNTLVWGDGGWSGLKIDREEDVKLIERACAIHKPDILFIEPFRGLWRGEENSATDMAVVMDELNRIANEYQLGVMLTHHETKASPESGQDPMNAARGSGVITDLSAVVERWKPVKGNRQRELEWTKTRFKQPPAPVRMEFELETWGFRLVEEDEHFRAIIEAFQVDPDAWWSINEIAEQIEESYDTTRRRLAKLHEERPDTVDRRSVPGQGISYRLKQTDSDHGGLAVI